MWSQAKKTASLKKMVAKLIRRRWDRLLASGSARLSKLVTMSRKRKRLRDCVVMKVKRLVARRKMY